MSKAGNFYFPESIISRSLSLSGMLTATKRTFLKPSVECLLGSQFRWIISREGLLLVVVVVCFHFVFPTLTHKENSNGVLNFSKIIENSITGQSRLYRKCIRGIEEVLSAHTHRERLTGLLGPVSMGISFSYLPPLGFFSLPPTTH